MPYQNNCDLPEGPQNVLPEHAKDIYREAYNGAYDEYKNPDDRRDNSDREETAHKVAWSAVKNAYIKGDDGKWHKK